MKTANTTTLACLCLLVMACTKETATPPTTLTEEASIREIAQIEVVLHELEGLYFNHTYQLYLKDESGRIDSHRPEYNHFAGIGDCANLDLNTDQNTLSLDFGEGCEDNFGQTRSGKISIGYTYADDRTGNKATISLKDYGFQKLLVDGKIQLERMADSPGADLKNYALSFTDMVITQSNTNQTAFYGNRTLVLTDFEDANPRTATLNVIQSISGTLSDGSSFSKNTRNGLIFLSQCWSAGTYFPNQGSESYRINNQPYSIDINSGCSYIFNVTTDSEERFEVNLSNSFSN